MSIRQGMGKDEHDQEGRLITAEYPHLYVVNVYVPNSGDGLKRLDYRLQQWDIHFAEYLQKLAAQKPVVLTGDLNCCHQEIDIHNPKKNLKSAGFTLVCFAELFIGTRHACNLLLLLWLLLLMMVMMAAGCWRADCLLTLVQRASGFSYIWMSVQVRITCWPDSVNLHSCSRGHCRLHNVTATYKCRCCVDHSMPHRPAWCNLLQTPSLHYTSNLWVVFPECITRKIAPTICGVLSGLLSLGQCNRMYVVL